MSEPKPVLTAEEAMRRLPPTPWRFTWSSDSQAGGPGNRTWMVLGADDRYIATLATTPPGAERVPMTPDTEAGPVGREPYIWRTKTSIRDGSPSGRFVVDWEEAEAALDALAVQPVPSGLDVRRVVQAITNIALRHGLSKDPPIVQPRLMSIYGYSRATPDMDAEIAAEYARLAHPVEGSTESGPTDG